MAKKFSTEIPESWDSGVGYEPWEGSGKFKPMTRCYHTHPGLKVGEHMIYGGSCIDPEVKDADVYIGFDRGMTFHNQPSWPWKKVVPFKGVEFLFPISDMCAPSNVQDFKDLIDWTCNQLQAGKKIHAGCIGGHGRTGTFLAAVVAQATGNKDAITYVRKNYCEKAVESSEQIKFLHKHYGIIKVEGSKSYPSMGSGGGKWSPSSSASVWPSGTVTQFPSKQKSLAFSGSKKDIDPVKSKRSIW